MKGKFEFPLKGKVSKASATYVQWVIALEIYCWSTSLVKFLNK